MVVSTFGSFKQQERAMGLDGVSNGLSFDTFAPYIPALTGLLGVSGNIASIKSQANANIRNIELAGESLRFSQANKKQQLEDLNRVVGDKLSESGLEALKAESRLKAAAAETGASGGSIDDAIATADINRLHRDAAILRTYDVNKAGKLSELVADRLGFERQAQAIVSGAPSGTASFVNALNTFTTGAMSGLNLLTPTQKEEFFGINTTGEVNG